MLPGSNNAAVRRYCLDHEIEIGRRSRGTYTFQSVDDFVGFLSEGLEVPSERGQRYVADGLGGSLPAVYGPVEIVEIWVQSERRSREIQAFGVGRRVMIPDGPEERRITLVLQEIPEPARGMTASNSLDAAVARLTGQPVRDPFEADYDPEWVPAFPPSRGGNVFRNQFPGGRIVQIYTFTHGYDQEAAFQSGEGGGVPGWVRLLLDIAPGGLLPPGVDRWGVPLDFPHFTVTIEHQRLIAEREVQYAVTLVPKPGTVWRPLRSFPDGPSLPEPEPQEPGVRRRALRIR